MSGSFAGASTQYLQNSVIPLVSTGYPCTVAAWVNLAAVSTVVRTIWAASDTATANNYLYLGMNGSEQMRVTAAAGGTDNSATALTALLPGLWYFAVGRFISATNRKIAVIHRDGLAQHATTATSRAPTGLGALAIGCLPTSAGATLPWDGLIGELWYTNTDIQADGLQLQDQLLRQVAFGGPFSVPHIAKDIVEYRSLRKDPLSGEAWDIYSGKGPQTWTNIAGVTTGPHPPLPKTYRSWEDFRRLTVI